MIKTLMLPELKDRERWKSESTLYNYVQVVKSFVVHFVVTEEARAFLNSLQNSDGPKFIVPKVHVGEKNS